MLSGGRVKAVLVLDNVAVFQQLHDLQLAVLEALVMQHLLDGHRLSRLQTCRLRVVRPARAQSASALSERPPPHRLPRALREHPHPRAFIVLTPRYVVVGGAFHVCCCPQT